MCVSLYVGITAVFMLMAAFSNSSFVLLLRCIYFNFPFPLLSPPLS